MARQPDEVMREVAERARRIPTAPPRLLQNPPGTGGPLPLLVEDEAMATVHRDWAEVHSAERERPADGASGSVRARVRARVNATADVALQQQQQADRYLIGDLIRAVDALAKRVDQMGQRLQAVEAVVDELVVVTGEDLTSIRAALVQPPAIDGGPDTEPSGNG